MIYDRRTHGHDRDAVHRVSGYLAGMTASEVPGRGPLASRLPHARTDAHRMKKGL